MIFLDNTKMDRVSFILRVLKKMTLWLKKNLSLFLFERTGGLERIYKISLNGWANYMQTIHSQKAFLNNTVKKTSTTIILSYIHDTIHMTFVSYDVNPMKSVLYFALPRHYLCTIRYRKTHVKSISELVKWITRK